MNYNLFIGLTAVVAAAVTVALTVLKDREDTAVSDERNARIIGLQQQVIQTQAELIAKTEELNNEVTGGNSLCVLRINISRSINHVNTHGPVIWSEMISAINEGQYGLSNVHIHVEKPALNWDFKRANHNITNPELEQDFDIVSLIGRQGEGRNGILLRQKDLPESQIKNNRITYVAKITIKKGTYTQVSKFILNNNMWLSATRLFDINMKTVYEDIDSQYPKKKDGTIDWSMFEPLEPFTPPAP